MNLKTGAAPRVLAVLFICIALLKCGAEASALCRAEEHPNGTTFYILDDSVAECEDYYWRVNGTAVAREKHLNQRLVSKRQFQSITLTGCRENVTRKNVCNGVPTNCSYAYRLNLKTSFIKGHCRFCYWCYSGAGHHLHRFTLKFKGWFQEEGETAAVPHTKIVMKMDCEREKY